MSHIDDVVSGGWWPLRHQATVDAALRYVRMACLVRADAGDGVVGKLNQGRDQYGRIREVDGSAGDVQCGLLWEAKDPVVPFDKAQLNDQPGDPPPRDFPSLGFAFPAIVRESKPLPRSAESGVPDQTTTTDQGKRSAFRNPVAGGDQGRDVGLPPIIYKSAIYQSTGSTRSKPPPPPPPPSVPPPPPLDTHVKVLPIQDEKLTADTRYAELTANTEHGVPTDMPGVVIAATHERRMIPLFFPAHWPLKAVNRNDPASRASLVFDLDKNGKVDAEIYARLQSAWRVIRLKTVTQNAAPMLNGAADSGQLAWQLAGAGKDGLAGFGLAYDNSGGAAGAAPPPPDGTTGTPTGGAGGGGGSGSGGKDWQFPTGVSFDAYFGSKATRSKNPAGGTGVGTGTVDGGAGHGEPAPPPQPTLKTQEKAKYQGVIAAYSHTVAAGPFDSGGPGCVHKLGETQDGEPVYSGHLHTNSYFRNPSFDGPLFFESRAQSKVDTGPHQMAVHLVWNPNLPHEHPSGTKNGKWWWYAESFDYALTSAPVLLLATQDSSGPTGPSTTGGPTRFPQPGTPTRFPDTWPPTNVPQIPDANMSTPGYQHPGGVPSINRVGTTATAVSTNRNLAVGDPTGKVWRASTALAVGPGFVFRPQDPTPGAPDLRSLKSGARPISADVLRTADQAPTTLRMEAFARRQRGNWRYGVTKNVSEFAGGTADIGGLWIGPADRDIQNEMSGQPYVKTPAMDPYFMFHPSVNVGTGGFNQDRFGEGSINFSTFNPAVFMPAATASGYVPQSDGAGSYAWGASTAAGASAIFGDGSDGVVNFDGTNTYPAFSNSTGAAPNLLYSLTRVVKATTFTIAGLKRVLANGFYVCATVSVTVDGHLDANGQPGAANIGGGSTVGPGAVMAAGAGGGNGAKNGTGTPAPGGGAVGANTVSSFQTAAGGAGGNAGAQVGGAGGTSTGLASDPGVLNTWTGMPGVAFTAAGGFVALTGGAGGGGGASDNANATGGGGGGGGHGIAVCSPLIGGVGQITSSGGDGGAATGTAGNAGGGGSGEGGFVITVGAVAASLSVTAVSGNVGAQYGAGAPGSFGNNGVWIKLAG